MATVFIPSLLRPLTNDRGELSVGGSTVGEVVNNLIAEYPGLADRLLEDGRLRGNLSVAVDGEITTMGLLETVDDDSEIHFVPAISGG